MNQEKTLENISIDGIIKVTLEETNKAKEENKKYKLVGKAVNEKNSIKMTVKLEKLDSEHPLYSVNGKNKALRYTSDTLGDLAVIGGASGATPAAASILRDIINIHRGYRFSK